MSNVSQKVLDAIELLSQSAINQAGFDKTIEAQILSCIDEAAGKYKCRYQDSIFYAYNNTPNVEYEQGDFVRILIPNNDFSKQKTIIGAPDKSGINYTSTVQDKDLYEIVGTNCITSDGIYYLDSNIQEYSCLLYQAHNETNLLTIDNDSLKKYLENSSRFVVEFDIQTMLAQKKQYQGSYGFIFKLAFYDNTAYANKIIRTFFINENNLIGNPYKLINKTHQTIAFEVDGTNFIQIEEISIFNKNFPYSAGSSSQRLLIGDMVFSSLKICGAKILNKEEVEGLQVFLNTPNGLIFNDEIDSLPLVAEAKVDGRVVLNDKLAFYWGVEDVSVDTQSQYYNQYLGAGWHCFNQKNIIDSENGLFEWAPAINSLDIISQIDINNFFKELFLKEIVLKVAAKYGDKITSKEIHIYNENTEKNISISSADGTVFYYDYGEPILTCDISDLENQFLNLENTFLFWAKENEDGSIEPLYPEEELNKIKIKMSEITNSAKIKCSVYEEGVFRGTSSIQLVNSCDPNTLSIIQGWDGKSVQINEDTILAPRIGAGTKKMGIDEQKKPIDKFTGVVLGVEKQTSIQNGGKIVKEDIGIFGYSDSQRSFFLNSKNGSAIFGLEKGGSLVIDPNPKSQKILLYSKDFWEKYNEEGFPLSYGQENENKAGMLIDLSTPAIRFGKGNFSINENGDLTAHNANLTGTMQTEIRVSNQLTKTQLNGGRLKVSFKRANDETPIEIMSGNILASSYAVQYGFLGNSTAYDGIAIGQKTSSNEIFTYYRCNLNNAQVRENCRHHFIGNINAEDDIECWGKTYYHNEVYCDNSIECSGQIVLKNNFGIQYNNKTAFRYFIDETNNFSEGLYVGIDSEKMFLTATNIYVNGSPIATSSDARKKQQINNLSDKYLQLMKKIKPVSFKYNAGISHSERIHTGFIAQDVLAAMESCNISKNQFAAFVDINKDNSEYALRYEEFISPMLLYIQSLEKEINILKEKIGD